jgi:hypothetical protein
MVTWCVVAVAMAVGGCANWNWDFAPPPKADPAGEPVQPKRVKDLEADLAAARSENAILKGRLDALTLRESQLADSLRDQKFLAEQGEKQIKVLARAPGERDTYKARCQELEAQILRLEADYAQLLRAATAAGAKIPPRTPPPASGPASQPSTRPSARPTSWPGAGNYKY